MKQKIFSKYIMDYNEEDLTINSVMNSDGKDTLFSYTFYMNNKDFLDSFKNVKDYVKPKKETQKHNNLIIDLDNFEIHYSNNSEPISEEDYRLAMKILKNALSNENPEIKKLKENLIKSTSDLKILEEMNKPEEGMDFTQQIENVKSNIENIKNEIEELME